MLCDHYHIEDWDRHAAPHHRKPEPRWSQISLTAFAATCAPHEISQADPDFSPAAWAVLWLLDEATPGCDSNEHLFKIPLWWLFNPDHKSLRRHFRKDPRAGSITILGHEEIESRLIDCKPENKKGNQYSQWQEWSLWQETERFRNDKDWDEAYFEKDHIQSYVHPLLFYSPCIQKPTKGIMSLHKFRKCRYINAPILIVTLIHYSFMEEMWRRLWRP